MSRLEQYVRVWAVMTAARHLTPPGRELLFPNAVGCVCLAAFWLPLEPAALVAAFALRIIAIVASLPYVHDAQHWCMQTDIVILVTLLYHIAMRKRESSTRWGSLTEKEADSVYESAKPTIRLQMIFLYTSAGMLSFGLLIMHATSSGPFDLSFFLLLMMIIDCLAHASNRFL